MARTAPVALPQNTLDKLIAYVAPGVAIKRAAQRGALADVVARKLGPRIGGRYVPKRDDRALRDIAVWQEFNGRNHKDVLKKFAISRRLLYSILSRRRREQP